MKVKDLLEELQDTSIYKKFKEENNDSFFSAGFFILDLEKKTENIQLDFFISSKQKVASFEFPFKEFKIHDDKIEKMASQDTNLKIDIDDLKSTCEEAIHCNNHSMKIEKIIAILRDDVWNLTCMDSFLSIARININAKDGKHISFTKGSLLDIAKPIKGKKK